jgi:hypothetical protein
MSLNQTLADLKRFAIGLAGAPAQREELDKSLIPSAMFSHKDYGVITLFGEDGRKYYKLIATLLAPMRGALSKNSAADVVHTVLFKTIDIRKENQSRSAESRANEAIDIARAFLSSPPAKWISCFPILGIKPPKEPWHFGDVVLIDINAKEAKGVLDHADRITETTKHSREVIEQLKTERHKQLVENHPEQAFALVTTQAIDVEAALEIARRKLRFFLDCLNFGVDCFQGTSGAHSFSDTEALRRNFETSLTLKGDFSFAYFSSQMIDGTIPMAAELFRQKIDSDPGLRRLFELLALGRLSAHQRRVLTAIHWAGRAAVENRIEDSFLFRAIALESLILGRSDTELTNRLAMSIVHLVGEFFNSRKDGVATIKRLYKERSKIVHSGTYEVAKPDAATLRRIVIQCFLKVLTAEGFQKMNGENDLDEWFEAAMRGDRLDKLIPTPTIDAAGPNGLQKPV